MISRRTCSPVFWSVLVVLMVSCSTAPKSGSGANEAGVLTDGAYPVMQGVTGATWTRFAVLRPKTESLTYRITTTDDAVAGSQRQATHEFAASDQVVDEVRVQGLSAAATYRLQILKDGNVMDVREFGLRPGGPNIRFAVVSCSDDHYAAEQRLMWSHLLSQAPDYIFTIGDNVYADIEDGVYHGDATPELLWRRYVQTRSRLAVFRARKLIPMIALWDDHDYGQNDGDRRYPQKRASLQIFKSFFPQDAERELHYSGPGAASAFGYGEQRFYFLDGRSFRSPNQDPPICREKKTAKACEKRARPDRGADVMAKREPETHFGREQQSWLMKLLEQGGSDVAWLITGDQWFGGYSPFESFEGNHPRDFKKFMAQLKDEDARVAFLSGDRHASEITKIEASVLGYETFELVSSPIHSKVYPSNWVEFPNARQIASVAEAFNYSVIDSRVGNRNWDVKIRNYKLTAPSGPVGLAFEKEMSIERPFAE